MGWRRLDSDYSHHQDVFFEFGDNIFEPLQFFKSYFHPRNILADTDRLFRNHRHRSTTLRIEK